MWGGLLNKALEYCKDVKNWSATSPAYLRMQAHIRDGNYLDAAEEVSSLSPGNKRHTSLTLTSLHGTLTLAPIHSGTLFACHFRKFLADTVGCLKIKDAKVLKALKLLNIPVMTTNYDNLIEDYTGTTNHTTPNGPPLTCLHENQTKGWETVTWNNVHEYILGPLKVTATLQSMAILSTLK